MDDVTTKSDIQEWIDKEFDNDDHSAMEFLISEWHQNVDGNFQFFKTHQRVSAIHV